MRFINSRNIAIAAYLGFVFILTITLPAQTNLTASDGSTGDQFGSSIDKYGNYIIVGAYHDDLAGVDDGSAYIFEKTNNGYVQRAKITSFFNSTDDNFGDKVAMWGDYVIVGAQRKNNYTGMAYIFKREGIAWNEKVGLLPNDLQEGDRFGCSVEICGDYAMVGAYCQNNGNGAVYIYKKDGEQWYQTQKLSPNFCGYWGYTISMYGDFAIMSANGENNNEGAAYILKRNNDNWVEEARITAFDGEEGDQFGESVEIWGNYVAISSCKDDDQGSNSGSVYIYKYENNNWIFDQKITASDGASDRKFGGAISLYSNYLAVQNLDYGGVWTCYIFERTSIGWSEIDKFQADGSIDDIFIDNDVLLIGDGGYEDNKGTVYIRTVNDSEASANSTIVFNFNTFVQPGGGDNRELSAAFHSLIFIDADAHELSTITFGTSEANAVQGEGWFDNENWEGIGTFQWAGGSDKNAELNVDIPNGADGFLLKMSSISNDLQMTVTIDGNLAATLKVNNDWRSGYVPIGDGIVEPVPSTEPAWAQDHYFPTFPSADRIYVFSARSELANQIITWVGDYRINQSYNTMMALTLVGMQGIINRNKSRLYLKLSYDDIFWIPYIEEHVEVIQIDFDPLSAVNFLLRKYSSAFSGAVVYDPDVPETINLATMIAGLENRIILAPEQLLIPGLDNFDDITDLRQLVAEQGWDTSEESKLQIYEWVYDNLWVNLEHRIIGAISPGPPTSGQIGVNYYYPLCLASRDLYVALKIPALWLDPRNQQEAELYDKFLDEAPSPIPVMGASPDEGSSLKPISEHGDWCPVLSWPNAPLAGGNVTVFSGIRPEIKPYQPEIDNNKVLATLGNKPVVTIWCSDGDNLHYQMNRGFSGPEWLWENVQESKIGWTSNPVLSNIAPIIWNYYIDTQDEVSIISAISGGGYTLPRYMNDQQLQNYLSYTSTYLNETGLKSICVEKRGGGGDWDAKLAEQYYNELSNTGYLGVYFGDTGWPWGVHFNYQNQPVPGVQQGYLLSLDNSEGIIDHIMNTDPDEIFVDLTGSVPWYWDRNIADYYAWQSGTIVQDADGYNGKSLYFSKDDLYLGTKVYGPFATLAPGEYNAVFHLKVSDNQTSQAFANIYVGRTDYTNDTGEWQEIAARQISPSDFTSPNAYQDFTVNFEIDDFKNNVEFKLDQTERASDISIDYIYVKRAESLSLPLFVPIFVVVTSPEPQADNVKSFVAQFENEGGIVLTPDEFLAALNPEYMIDLAETYLGAGHSALIQAQNEMNDGKYLNSLLTIREALKGVVSVEDYVISSEFKLDQNYPNPFNPSTIISFSLPERSEVKLTVYDILGREVAVLFDREINAGSHKINFNAKNISSGVYFYVLKTNENIQAGKMLLLR